MSSFHTSFLLYSLPHVLSSILLYFFYFFCHLPSVLTTPTFFFFCFLTFFLHLSIYLLDYWLISFITSSFLFLLYSCGSLCPFFSPFLPSFSLLLSASLISLFCLSLFLLLTPYFLNLASFVTYFYFLLSTLAFVCNLLPSSSLFPSVLPYSFLPISFLPYYLSSTSIPSSTSSEKRKSFSLFNFPP